MESVTERLGATYCHIHTHTHTHTHQQEVVVMSGISTLSFTSLYADKHSGTYNHKYEDYISLYSHNFCD